MSKSGVDFVSLVGTEEKTEDGQERRPSRNMSRQSSIRSVSTNSINSLDGSCLGNDDDEEQNENFDGVQMEASSKGTVKGSVALNYYKAGAHWSVVCVMLLSFLVVQLLASAADIWVSVW